jgi:hypothetical protein
LSGRCSERLVDGKAALRPITGAGGLLEDCGRDRSAPRPRALLFLVWTERREITN